ncbi:MAG TPA: DUF305 domain-containing protein [Pseudonocardiaceae bacterium]|nr:DUF305 domain-containing protein [Pseudonocardiaceae bacterium]
MSAPTAPPEADQPAPQEARWIRPVLAVVAVVGLLLLGAAGGLLISGVPGSTAPAVPAIDSVDVGFSQDMTVHHQQAVAMAAWERDHTTDPVLHQLAADIEATQTSQIGRMQGWLELWGAPALPTGGHMAWMTEPSHDHTPAPAGGTRTMPGMASEDELAAMRAATGPQLDVLFLQLMLRHHEGGAGMLQYAAERASVPQVRNLAAQMLRSQTSESTYLRQLLAERGGQPLPL